MALRNQSVCPATLTSLFCSTLETAALSKPQILVFGDCDDWDLQPLGELYELHQVPADNSLGHLSSETKDAIVGIAFRGHSQMNAAIMDELPNLGVIANYGVGYDTIDVAHASSRGIKVSNTPDVLTEDVADLAIGLMIAQSRGMVGASAWVRSGEWQQHGEYRLGTKISGKKAGIVGLGRIGRAIGERLVPFGMDIHYYSRDEKDTPNWTYHGDITELAAAVDILFVSVSGGPTTKGIVGKDAIEAVGPNGLLVNISRGTTIDEGALLDALESGTLGAAALDVFLSEPNLDQRFLALDNALLQPHQSSGTVDTRKAIGALQRANLAAYFAGEPLVTPVN